MAEELIWVYNGAYGAGKAWRDGLTVRVLVNDKAPAPGRTHHLDWGDGSPAISSLFGTHTYSTAGTYKINMWSNGPNYGWSASAETTVFEPTDIEPPAFTVHRTNSTRSIRITINPDDRVSQRNVRIAWGDGSLTSGKWADRFTHEYHQRGTYLITVRDEVNGNEARRSVVVDEERPEKDNWPPQALVTTVGYDDGSTES